MNYEHLRQEDAEIFAAMEQELTRQRDHIELIASENFTSPAVMEAVGSHLTNKYAEGYPGKRFYGGCEYVDIVENICRDRAKELFGAEHANVQPHSGSQANVAVYLALTKPGDVIMGMDLACGGHLTHGAKASIAYDAKPHLGTDVLSRVVVSIRGEIEALGGEVRFRTRLDGLDVRDGALRGVTVTSGGVSEYIGAESLILATGHSARDTFKMLLDAGLLLEPKAFSMGARIEHLQADIDLAQYGAPRGKKLPAADYGLNVHLPDGRGVYTFCMCPGGEVISAASETGGVVTNGMSYSGRAGKNANSALLVSVSPGDFPYAGPLGGAMWQREIERRAFKYAGGRYLAPAQLVGDFLAGQASSGPGRVEPSCRPGVFWGDLRCVLPEVVSASMAEALPLLGRKLHGFDAPDAVLTGPETRSSSPVRIPRDGTLCSAVRGLYPCGEGAGWAGGITSAAVDGMKCAEAVIAALGAEI